MRLQALSRNSDPYWIGVYLSLLLIVCVALALTGCAQTAQLNNLTLDVRQAAHDAFLAQAAMTLRHAQDLQNLEKAAQAIQPAPVAPAVPATITPDVLKAAPVGSILTIPADKTL